MTKMRTIFFFLFLLVCFSEQLLHYGMLLRGIQPHQVLLPTFYLQLNPQALVFDRVERFVTVRNVTFFYSDGSSKTTVFREKKESFNNVLEVVLSKKAFTSIATPRMLEYFFCGQRFRSLEQRPDVKVEKFVIFSQNVKTLRIEHECKS